MKKDEATEFLKANGYDRYGRPIQPRQRRVAGQRFVRIISTPMGRMTRKYVFKPN